jgi:hypothetical protein
MQDYVKKSLLINELYKLISDRPNQSYDVLWIFLDNEVRDKFTSEELEDFNRYIVENAFI